VRGDDHSSRYPPRGVWFGLILMAAAIRGLAAQDGPAEGAARLPQEAIASAPQQPVMSAAERVHAAVASRLDVPIVLAAGQVVEWKATDGLWVYLQGDASILHGARGLHAREAIVRIADVSTTRNKISRVEVYAEGEVRLTSDMAASRAAHHAVFETSHVQLQCYNRSGVTTPKTSPWNMAIVHRSGFRSPAQQSGDMRAQGRAASPARAITGPVGSPVPPRADPMVRPAQYVRQVPQASAGPVAVQGTTAPAVDAQVAPARAPQVPGDAPIVDLPPIEGATEVQVPNLAPNRDDLPPNIQPLPDPDGSLPVPAVPGNRPAPGASPGLPLLPFVPGTQRITSLYPRSGRELEIRELPTTPDGVRTFIIRGGINMITKSPKFGIVDIESDEAVIWRGPDRTKREPVMGPNGETWVDDDKQPMEVYLEGNVVLRQDENKIAGRGDQRTVRAPKAYYNFLTDRMLAPNAEIDLMAPTLLAPVRIKSPRIEQFRALVTLPNGTVALAEQPEIRAEPAEMTGSRFPDPGYDVTMKSIDITRYARPLTNPITGKEVGDPNDPAQAEEEVVWHIDSRQNVYWAGPFPMFYWPRISTDIDDQTPPLRMIGFNTNNYFGEQIKTDWNGFRLINQRKPKWIDIWNVDLDYLSARTKDFPALGSEMGWYGTDFLRDLSDPYHKLRNPPEYFTKSYYGYFDIWGLEDSRGADVLGTGPGIVTNGPPGAGKAGFQRSNQPYFQDPRERINIRHFQRFLPDDDDHLFQDLRAQLEFGYASDRNFIEEYYKRLFDAGQDQETLAYGIWQKDNQVIDIWTEANLQNWYTDTQWLPRVDYFRLGDSFFNNLFSYYQHSGMDYAVTHTDIMVNNPNLFAYMPYDPVSNTSGTFSSGRFYTNHELDMPLNFWNVFRLVPYVQGQAVGWTDQLGGGPLGHAPTGAMGRIWGGVGARAEFTAWKQYPWVSSELMNVHGFNNKISLFVDARAAYSNVKLNDIAVQDDLDDNTYEYVRRYLAITSFTGGILPFPYDPRHLILRQMVSPITGTTDVQASIDTVQMGVHQRLQTKRGPFGRRRIVDYMTLDASTTYFPNAVRDNFGTPWGQAMYNYQWYIGDRTSIVSSGWFEFFKLVGSSPLPSVTGYNPNGLNIITSGVSISRPPRSNLYLGYIIIDTGPIKTSAVNVSLSYWLSPKWYGTFSESYDFGDAVSLGSMFAFTRIGADYLTTIGLSVDPQRQSYMFAFQITPRLSPGLGSGGSATSSTFDTRFAPTQ
jgi:hypothetical protein